MEPAQKKTEVQQMARMSMIMALREISQAAADGDAQAFKTLDLMLADCRDPQNWISQSAYCSGVVHALGRIQNMKAMQLLIRLARDLPEGTPAGAIELLASILPEFRRFVMGSLRELIQRDMGSPAYLVAVQCLCNLYIEDKLAGSDVEFLAHQLESFQSDDYLTQHIADLVAADLRAHKDPTLADPGEVFGELLVES